jgi:nitrogen fixation NifU-like protein
MSMQNLYEQDILDHYQNPRNFGLLPTFDFISPLYNPSCGDSITMCGTIEANMLSIAAFEGKGCVLSLAMASMLTVFSKGKTINELLLCNDDLVEELLKTQLGPKRLQCGMLPLQALQKGLKLYLEKIS